MGKIWKWVLLISLGALLVGLILIGVGYFGGSSFERLIATTDIADLTKFFSREQLTDWVYAAFNLWETYIG